MAGAGTNHRSSGGRSRGHQFFCKFSVFSIWFGCLVAMEMHALVDAKCTFTWRDVNSSSTGNGWDLDLICECAKEQADFAVLLKPPITIKYQDRASGVEQSLFTDNSGVNRPPNVQDIEPIANEQVTDNKVARSRLYLRLKGYTHNDSINYVCYIFGRNDKDLIARKNLSLPAITGPGTTTATTATTRAAKTTYNVQGKPPDTRSASEIGNTEQGITRVGIYVVVALSGLLLVTIVIILMCFVRVRERRKREKLDVEKDLDPGDLLPHTANHACALHASCQPVCQHQADVSVRQLKGKKDRRGPRDETVPLLNIRCPEGCDLRHPRTKSTTTTNDDDDATDIERRENLLKDYPRRPRPRARHSRSCDHLYREKLPYHRCLESRPQNPRHVCDYSSDEEGYDGRRERVCRHLPRSRSEYCFRYPRYRYAVPREDAYWGGYCPRCQATTGGEIPVFDHHAVSPITARGLPRFCYDDAETAYVPRNARGGREAVPLRVRVQEGNNRVYGNYTGPQARGRLFESSSDGEMTLQGDPLEGLDLEGDDEGEGRMTAHGRGPSVNRPAQPTLLPEHLYPADNPTSSRRHRHFPSSSPPPAPPPAPLHHSTTPTRRRSPDRRARSAPRPYHRNLSHPHLSYLADEDRAQYLHDAPEAEEDLRLPPQFTATCLRPPRRPRVKGQRRSRSLGNIEDEDDENDCGQPPRYPYRRRRPSGRPAAAQGLGELSQLSSRREREEQRQMNFLSRDSSPPQRSPPAHLLNVPVGRVPSPGSWSARDQQHDTTQRKMPVGDVPVNAPRVEAESRRPTTQRARAAQASESSPGTTPSLQRRPPSSSSDNGDPRRVVTEAEINLRDIKADNETERKRPVSVKIGNTPQRPVVCVSDAATNHGAKPHTPAQRGLQRKESARSGGADRVVREEMRGGRLEDLGIEILSSENSGNSLCSNFTEHNHSTRAKVLHPQP